MAIFTTVKTGRGLTAALFSQTASAYRRQASAIQLLNANKSAVVVVQYELQLTVWLYDTEKLASFHQITTGPQTIFCFTLILG